MPAKNDLLQALMEKVERNERNEANYEQFLKLLNWRDSPGEMKFFILHSVTPHNDQHQFSPGKINTKSIQNQYKIKAKGHENW